ncbi:MAG: hypothetical protein K2X66_02220 [Cyanobacteria bacterium]|nr:hypothetical protein [Cyanobacteriota bacterium]
MNPTAIKFAGVAHIVRPKHEIDFYRGYETAKATQTNPETQIKEWRKDFEYDYRQAESLMIWGKDLEKAGDTSQWGFNEAYAYATGIIKKDSTKSLPAEKHGGPIAVGRTNTEGRAVLYKHPE